MSCAEQKVFYVVNYIMEKLPHHCNYDHDGDLSSSFFYSKALH